MKTSDAAKRRKLIAAIRKKSKSIPVLPIPRAIDQSALRGVRPRSSEVDYPFHHCNAALWAVSRFNPWAVDAFNVDLASGLDQEVHEDQGAPSGEDAPASRNSEGYKPRRGAQNQSYSSRDGTRAENKAEQTVLRQLEKSLLHKGAEVQYMAKSSMTSTKRLVNSNESIAKKQRAIE